MDINQENTLTDLFIGINELLLKNELDDALNAIESIIENFPNEAESYFLYAEFYLKKGICDKAIEYLYQASLLDSENIKYHGRLAEQLFLIGEIDAAIEQYQDILQLQPTLGWAHIGLGNAFERKGYIAQSIQCFEQALSADSESIELRERLKQLRESYENDADFSQTVLTSHKEQDIDFPSIKYVPFDLGNPSINYAGFVDGIHDNIISGWALDKAELTICQQLELVIADRVVAKFVTHTPRPDISGIIGTKIHYGFEFSLLNLLKNNDNFKKLVNSLSNNKSVQCNVRFSGTDLFLKFPLNYNNKINLFVLLSNTSAKELMSANEAYDDGHHEKALTLYKIYLNEYSLNWFIQHRVGDLYLHLKKYDDAKRHYTEALVINPNYSWSLHNLSLACYLSGDWSAALVNYQRLRKVEPSFWDDNKSDYTVQKHLGYMLLHSNKEKEARKVFENAILSQEHAWDLYLDLAISPRKTTLKQKTFKSIIENVLPELATIDDVLNLKADLRHFLFPLHSVQWRNLMAKAPVNTAPSQNAKGFLEAISVCKLTQEAVVVGWIVHTQDSVLWLEDNLGNSYSLTNAYHSFRRDVYDLFVHEFGSAAGNASIIVRLKGIQAGSFIRLKTYSAAGIHILHETYAQELPVNPIAAAKWLFSVAIPIAKFHERVVLVDLPILESLTQNYGQLQSTLPVQVTQCGKGLTKPIVSIIVPLYGRVDFVEHQLIEFINDAWLLENAELIYVIDDPKLVEDFIPLAQTLYALYKLPFRWIWGNGNRGFSGANNLGVDYANGEYLVFLNSDAFPQKAGWLQALIAVLKENADIGAVAPRLIFADGSIQHAGMEFMRNEELGVWINHHPYLGLDPNLDPATALTTLSGVTGACMVMRRTDFDNVLGWDTGYLIGDFEDSDLCLKLRSNGFKIAYLPSVQLTHLERQSFRIQGEGDFRTRLVLYNAVRHQSRWKDLLASPVTPELV